MTKIITSSDLLDDIDQNFKVSAGPGAGKTYWLTRHIKNVLQNSTKITNNRKIACITYTNIGVEVIKNRLGNNTDNVEVSTIHSFLYFNIFKPYIYLIAKEYDLDFLKIKRHEDITISRSKVIDWINTHEFKEDLKSTYSINVLTRRSEMLTALAQWLESIRFDYKLEQYISTEIPREIPSVGRQVLEKDFLSLKKLYWKNGRIAHEDVLFFSYLLIKRYPFILNVLVARYPFLFIDEFQDTSPIQAYLVDVLADKGMLIGLIGDYCQSIYGFQGAKASLFKDVALPQQINYLMQENRRSTETILTLLNHLRSKDDLIQKKDKQKSPSFSNGRKTTILVGNKDSLIDYMEREFDDDFTILARKNSIVNSFMSDQNYKNLLLESDSNRERRLLILIFIESIELALKTKFDDAFFQLERLYRMHGQVDILDENQVIVDIIRILTILCSQYEHYKDENLIEFITFIKLNCIKESPFLSEIKIATPTRGNPLKFYNTTTYYQVSLNVQEESTDSAYRTIHKSKGDEFDNVCLVLEKEKDLGFILKPEILENEEHRISYVGVSRARKNLFIHVPELKTSNKNKIEKLGLIDVIEYK